MKRKKLSKKHDKAEKIPKFYIFMACLILLLYFMFVGSTLIFIVESYSIIFTPNYSGSSFEKYTSFESMIINPIRDMIIAVLFAYLYYYKGMKD